MSFHLSAVIEDKTFLRCTLSSSQDDPIIDPVICFSMMVPATVISGGEKVESLGGFLAIRLNGVLEPNSPLAFVVGLENPRYKMANRIWYPASPYLRLADRNVDVAMDIPRGVKTGDNPAPTLPRSGLALIPAPASWEPSEGELEATHFNISGAFADAIASVDALCERRNLSPLSGDGPEVRISSSTGLPSSGYKLVIGDNIELKATDKAGALYGLISLLNLRQTQGTIPKGVIEDAPRFEWRGFMLDCVREFYPVSAILKLLDLMALLKLNRFHWHFSDDEAFRLEVETAPDLWQKSAFRGEGQALPGLFGAGAGPKGGSYSREDVKKIVAHAAALNIEVLPEIEVPAHALALTTIRPELRDPNDTGSEVSVQGYPRNSLNPARDETWDLLEPLSLEVASLFPFNHLHLGGDELPEGTWDGSPLVESYKRQHELETYQDVQGHLMDRLARHIGREGITACAWQEAADGCTGGIGNDAILFSWTGAGPGREAAKNGYRVVMCPAQHAYLDMAHTDDEDDWGTNWAATFGLDRTYQWNPIPDGDESIADKIIGLEGTFWSEFTHAPEEYEAMIAPRILGLATKAWSQDNATNLDDLRASATCYMPFFETIDWIAHGEAIMRDTPADNVKRADD